MTKRVISNVFNQPIAVLLGLALAVMAVVSAFPSQAKAQSAANVSQLIDMHFKNVVTVQGRFQQRLLDEDGELLEQAEGEMWLQRPGRFRWNYKLPYEQEIGSDGTTLWIYDAELEQITLRPVGEGLAKTPAVLLSGEGRLTDAFSVSDLGVRDGVAWALLLPNEQDTDFKQVKLGFRGKDLAVMELTDSLDQVTQIEFVQQQHNKRLPPNTFELSIPQGAEVVGERG